MATIAERAEPFRPLFEAAGRKYGVPPALLAAIAYQESRFNPNAFNPEKGSNPSVGLMQISVPTAIALGHKGALAELYNPALSVELAAKLLRDNFARIRRDAPGLSATELQDRAVAAYNAGWSKERKGDAPRTAAGAFINQAGYVAPVRNYFTQLSQAMAAPPAPPTSPERPRPAGDLLPPAAAFPGGAIAPGAIIAALLLATMLVVSSTRRESRSLAASG